jgi:hypothetical protein
MDWTAYGPALLCLLTTILFHRQYPPRPRPRQAPAPAGHRPGLMAQRPQALALRPDIHIPPLCPMHQRVPQVLPRHPRGRHRFLGALPAPDRPQHRQEGVGVGLHHVSIWRRCRFRCCGGAAAGAGAADGAAGASWSSGDRGGSGASGRSADAGRGAGCRDGGGLPRHLLGRMVGKRMSGVGSLDR